jgi:methylated-DNA-[protein]-cysteine S-methyltransferase
MRNFLFYYSSPIGYVKIQSTPENLFALQFIDDVILEQTMNKENLKNDLIELCIFQLNEYFQGKRREFDLPVTQMGTAFQQRVWESLNLIPYGHTISYQKLSRNYGEPRAIRAIASANGKNNLPIIIPCHRVIGSNHSLVGYSGGLWRKRWLLDHEAKYFSGMQKLFN